MNMQIGEMPTMDTSFNRDLLLDSLSCGKKGNILLEQLRTKFGIDVVLDLRKKGNTPKEVAKILEVN